VHANYFLVKNSSVFINAIAIDAKLASSILLLVLGFIKPILISLFALSGCKVNCAF